MAELNNTLFEANDLRYTLLPKDTLTGLAVKFSLAPAPKNNTAAEWAPALRAAKQLADYNGIPDMNKLPIGATINIPMKIGGSSPVLSPWLETQIANGGVSSVTASGLDNSGGASIPGGSAIDPVRPGGSMPFTGNLGSKGPLIVGGALLLIGGLAILFGRRGRG